MGRHLFWIWQAFTDLNIRRPVVGMGEATYISYAEIEAYCRLKGITSPSDRERLVRLLDRLDREWMRLHIEKREKETKKLSKGKPPPPSHSPPRHRSRPSTTQKVA